MADDLIQHLLRHFFTQIGWDTSYNLNLKREKKLEHILEAYMDMQKWIIHFKYPPNFLELFEELQKKYRLHELYEPKTE